MKNFLALAVLSSLVSASALATGIDVRFSGACAAGSADIAENDIEYSNLDLDFLTVTSGSKECVITTTFPGKHGLRLNISDFVAQGLGISDQGTAFLSVNHRFNGQQDLVHRDYVINGTKDLVAQKTAIGTSECGQAVVLRTKITTKVDNAQLFQDSATSNLVSYKIGYTPCH